MPSRSDVAGYTPVNATGAGLNIGARYGKEKEERAAKAGGGGGGGGGGGAQFKNLSAYPGMPQMPSGIEAQYDPYLKRQAERVEAELSGPGYAKTTSEMIERAAAKRRALTVGQKRELEAEAAMRGGGAIEGMGSAQLQGKESSDIAGESTDISLGRGKDYQQFLLGSTEALGAVGAASRADRASAMQAYQAQVGAWGTMMAAQTAREAQQSQQVIAQIEMLSRLMAMG